MLFAAFALAMPAAAEPGACTADLGAASPEVLRSCVLYLQGRVKAHEENEKELRESVNRAWKAFGDPRVFITELPEPAPTMFGSDGLIVSLWQLRRNLGDIGLADPTRIIQALDTRFAAGGGEGLRTFFKKYEVVIVAAASTKIRPLIGAGGFGQHRDLLEKPFQPLLGAMAYAWYEEQCRADAPCQSRVFADSFAEHYGRPPTREDAYLLNSLYVRFQRGGKHYVTAIQEVGLAVLAQIEDTKKAAAEPGK